MYSTAFLAPIFWIALAFFFQAGDGIRDLTVTGVQTCALPIFEDLVQCLLGIEPLLLEGVRGGGKTALVETLARGCNLDQYGVSGREGITAEELLYRWDKDEQREWMAEARARGLDVERAREQKWTREFLILGEFLGAYDAAASAEFPPLLFMDEIDKVGVAIEDMLLQP